MIKITNEIDGKKYELVPEICNCEECAFVEQNGYGYCELDGRDNDTLYQRVKVCVCLRGIWKEVRDEAS